jgi:hypothetical protein
VGPAGVQKLVGYEGEPEPGRVQEEKPGSKPEAADGRVQGRAEAQFPEEDDDAGPDQA